ncbi:hypothetical protein FBU59_002885, partial [Linderina macrospora]
MLRLLSRSIQTKPAVLQPTHWFSTTPTALKESRNDRKAQSNLADLRKRREKFAYLKQGTQRRRLDNKSASGRSGGGQSQQFESRMRRARDQKTKYEGARDFAIKHSETPEQRSMAEARILRQRAKQLKSRGTPGLGFTPARFKLMHIENEFGTDLNAISGGTRSLTIKELEEVVESARFDSLGLRKEVAAAATLMLTEQFSARNPQIKEDPEIKPSDIQALGIPEILGKTRIKGKQTAGVGPNVFLAAETGSGKTLAYALPLVSQLKQEEIESKNVASLRRERRPRALVVVPSRELVKQVAATFKRLSHTAKVRAVGLHQGMTRRRIRDMVEQGPIDILISTPGAVLRYMQRDAVFSPASVQRLVVDEADSMMDTHSFGEQMTRVLDLVRNANSTQDRTEQAVFVSATLPKQIREQIIRRYPDVVHVTTPSLHRAPQKLTQSFIDVSREFQGHRLNALWYVLRTAAADKHLIIFCNNKKHANLVHRQMYSRGIPALLLLGTRADRRSDKDKARVLRRDEKENEEGENGGDGVKVSRKPGNDADAWDKATWFVEQPEKEVEQPAVEEEDEVAEPISGADINDLQAPVPHYDREEVLQAFYSSDPIPDHLLPKVAVDPENAALADKNGANRKIMVCTDLASRG